MFEVALYIGRIKHKGRYIDPRGVSKLIVFIKFCLYKVKMTTNYSPIVNYFFV